MTCLNDPSTRQSTVADRSVVVSRPSVFNPVLFARGCRLRLHIRVVANSSGISSFRSLDGRNIVAHSIARYWLHLPIGNAFWKYWKATLLHPDCRCCRRSVYPRQITAASIVTVFATLGRFRCDRIIEVFSVRHRVFPTSNCVNGEGFFLYFFYQVFQLKAVFRRASLWAQDLYVQWE